MLGFIFVVANTLGLSIVFLEDAKKQPFEVSNECIDELAYPDYASDDCIEEIRKINNRVSKVLKRLGG